MAAGFTNFYLDRMLTFSYAETTSDKSNIDKGLASSDVFFKKVPQDKINFLDYKYRGQLLQAANKDSLAIIEYEKAIAKDETKKGEILPVIAKAYLKSKKYQKGIDLLEEKLKTAGLTSAEYFDLGKAYFFGPKKYALADSAFTKVIAKSPTFTSGYYWKARSIYFGNLTDKTYPAKAYYEKTFEMIKPEERATPANKSMVLESCKYLGDYYFSSTAKDLEKAKSLFTIVQELDPADTQAKAFFSKVK